MEENGELVKFLFNEEKEVIAEETNNEVIRYIRGLGIISSDSESARTYYHYVSDNQGSVRLILTDTTNDRKIRNYYYYDAFGESVISHEDIHNRFRFDGEQYDPVTSQYYLRARYYNPVIGRFTQEDTYYGDGLTLYEYCRNNPVLYRDPSGHDVENQKNLYKNESGGGTKQIIKNRYPNEPQSGKRFNYTIENGKIYIENGIQNVDFVIDMDGNLHLGRGHSFLANGMDVQAAGTLKVNSQGYVRAISNGSGHYTPTVEQGRMFPGLLNDLGIRTKNAWLELGDYRLTPSGYVDLSKSSIIVEQLK